MRSCLSAEGHRPVVLRPGHCHGDQHVETALLLHQGSLSVPRTHSRGCAGLWELPRSYVEEDLHCLRTPLSAEDTALLESVKWGCHQTDAVQPLPGCADD